MQIAETNDLFGGDLTLDYDPELVTFRGGSIDGADLTVVEALPGRVSFSFDGLAPSESGGAGIRFSFDSHGGDVLGSLKLTGLVFDPDFMPLAQVEIEARLNGTPVAYSLYDNYPNPFNPATQIRYDLAEAGQVHLTVFNALGQEVARLVNTRQAAGSYAVTWDAEGFASGIYYYTAWSRAGSMKFER